MSNLSQILSDNRLLVDMLIESNGLVTQEIESRMAEIQAQLQTKVDSYYHIMIGLEGTAEDLKTRAKEFSNAAKALESASDRLRDYAKQTMVTNGVERISGELVEFQVRKTRPRTQINIEELPEEFIQFIPTPDKEAIEAALKEGKKVPGVEQEGGFALYTSVPKKLKETRKQTKGGENET